MVLVELAETVKRPALLVKVATLLWKEEDWASMVPPSNKYILFKFVSAPKPKRLTFKVVTVTGSEPAVKLTAVKSRKAAPTA